MVGLRLIHVSISDDASFRNISLIYWYFKSSYLCEFSKRPYYLKRSSQGCIQHEKDTGRIQIRHWPKHCLSCVSLWEQAVSNSEKTDPLKRGRPVYLVPNMGYPFINYLLNQYMLTKQASSLGHWLAIYVYIIKGCNHAFKLIVLKKFLNKDINGYLHST